MDITGVPDALLSDYMVGVHAYHGIPVVSVLLGSVTMALGYGIDIGERVGCAHMYLGLAAGAMFAFSTFLIALVMRTKRRALGRRTGNPALGVAFLNTWHDRVAKRRADGAC